MQTNSIKKNFSESAKSNIIILVTSYLAFPLSLLFKRIGIKANTITYFSFLSGVLSFYFLIIFNNYFYFILFFYMSIILDFCDGQIARMTNTVNNTEFDLDSFIDLIKNCLVLTGIAIIYNNLLFWILTCFVIFLYVFFIKTHEAISRFTIRSKTSSNIQKNFFHHFKIIFLTINAHTFYILPALLINIMFAFTINIYILFIFFINSLINIKKINKIKKKN